MRVCEAGWFALPIQAVSIISKAVYHQSPLCFLCDRSTASVFSWMRFVRAMLSWVDFVLGWPRDSRGSQGSEKGEV